MCKKLMFLISLVSVLVLAGIGSADDFTWEGDSPWGPLFVDPCNWDPFAPYGPDDFDDTAYIPSVGYNPTIVITAIQVEEIRGPAWNSDSDHEILLVEDANLVTSDRWQVEETGDGIAYITLVDRARIEVGDRFYSHDDDHDQATVISMYDDSEFIINKDLRCGDNGGDYFELNMTDNAYLYAGNDDDGFRFNDGEAHINLSGNAVLDAEYIRWRARTAGAPVVLNITENSRLNCFDDHFEFAGGDGNPVINLTDDARIDISGGEWRGGEDNDFAGVWTLNMPCGDNPLLTTADDFWMIKHYEAENGYAQVNLHGGTIDVDGSLRSEFDNWNLDICCNGVLIVNGDAVAEMTEHYEAGRITVCGYYMGCGSQYDLVIDYNNVNPGRTTVYVEHDPYQVYDPDPVCCTDPDAEDVPTDLCLSWTPGDAACPPPLTFFVYLHTNYDKVADGNLSAMVGYDLEANEFCVEDLCLGETYYWRVDAVCDCYQAVGDVWCFDVVDCLTFEDFESYDNSCDPTAIFATWLDGAGNCGGIGGNGTGSSVYSAVDPDPEQEDKVMEYYYNSTGWEREYPFSEANQPLDPPVDFTDDCEKLLELWFYGDPDNMTESMWVALSDGTNDGVVTYGKYGPDSPDDIKNAEWNNFVIDLQDFVDASVDISAVTEFSIGFGPRGRTGEFPGDPIGLVYFDDITLCATKCIPKYARDGDIDDDCDVDWDDVDLMADDWLEDLCPGFPLP